MLTSYLLSSCEENTIFSLFSATTSTVVTTKIPAISISNILRPEGGVSLTPPPLIKPQAIQTAEEFNKSPQTALASVASGLNTISQTSLLGVANPSPVLSTSNGLVFNVDKLVVAGILSIIPTLAIAIPFILSNQNNQNNRRRRE